MSRHIEQGGDNGDAPAHASYQVDQLHGCAVVRAGGEIDTHTVRAFHEVFDEERSQASTWSSISLT